LLEGPATSCMWSSHLHILWTQLAYTYSAHLSRPGFPKCTPTLSKFQISPLSSQFT
jgi:hypothetical protein